MCCKFKRTVNRTVRNICAGIGGISVLVAIVIGVIVCLEMHFNHIKVTDYTILWVVGGGWILWIASLLLGGVAESIIPPDFEYTIRVVQTEGDKFILFEFSDKDHRKLNTRFDTTSKNRKHMTLEDGYARIQIAYDRNVEEFLKEIKE